MFKRQPSKPIEGYMFVDPGFNTGITYWRYCRVNPYDDSNSKYQYICLQLEPDKKYKGIGRQYDLWKQFNNLLDDFRPHTVVFEDVTVRNDEQSILAAKSGNIIKLDRVLTGYLAACVFKEIDCELLRVVDWKGNMNDAQVQRRIKWLTGLEFPTPHIADSFGMTLNEMGIFK